MTAGCCASCESRKDVIRSVDVAARMDLQLDVAVRRRHNRVVWNQVTLPIIHRSPSTGMYPLSRCQSSTWMQAVSGAWLENLGGESVASTSALSTGVIHGKLIVERTYQCAAPEDRMRYDTYLFVRTADGRAFQAGPDKAVRSDYPGQIRHHEPSRPECSTM